MKSIFYVGLVAAAVLFVGLIVTLVLAYYGAIIYVAAHFIHKFW